MLWDHPLQCMEHCKGKRGCRRYRMLCPNRVHPSCQKERSSKNRRSIESVAIRSLIYWYNHNRKIICEKWDFGKSLILRDLTKMRNNHIAYFLRNWRKRRKSLQHLRKMSNFVSVKPSKIEGDFRKSPFDVNCRKSFAKFSKSTSYWLSAVCIFERFQNSGFDSKKTRHLRKIGQNKRK